MVPERALALHRGPSAVVSIPAVHPYLWGERACVAAPRERLEVRPRARRHPLRRVPAGAAVRSLSGGNVLLPDHVDQLLCRRDAVPVYLGHLHGLETAAGAAADEAAAGRGSTTTRESGGRVFLPGRRRRLSVEVGRVPATAHVPHLRLSGVRGVEFVRSVSVDKYSHGARQSF